MTLSAAYEKHPEHRIELDAERVGVRVTLEGSVLAETVRGLNLRETNHHAVVYVPREDVHMERLMPSDHSTHCPFKGDASYFRYRATAEKDSVDHEIAWSYEVPFEQMEEIRGHLAFYSDRVTIERLTD